MVATIAYNDETAILQDDGTWTSDNAAVAAYLNARFSTKAIPPSPAAGSSQYAEQARAAALKLGATIAWPEPETEDDGRVY